VWIQGDLHAENFGTYMDGAGRIVFDVNDFDEAYVGHVSWDLRRFAASFALLSWRKAFGDEVISDLLRATSPPTSTRWRRSPASTTTRPSPSSRRTPRARCTTRSARRRRAPASASCSG
jgi:hypothetical protein